MKESGKSPRVASDDSGDFFVSLAVAATTDNWFLGALAGGDIVGAALGDFCNDSDSESSD